jgi:hypothetical protein
MTSSTCPRRRVRGAIRGDRAARRACDRSWGVGHRPCRRSPAGRSKAAGASFANSGPAARSVSRPAQATHRSAAQASRCAIAPRPARPRARRCGPARPPPNVDHVSLLNAIVADHELTTDRDDPGFRPPERLRSYGFAGTTSMAVHNSLPDSAIIATSPPTARARSMAASIQRISRRTTSLRLLAAHTSFARQAVITAAGLGSVHREMSPANPRVTISSPSMRIPITWDSCTWSGEHSDRHPQRGIRNPKPAQFGRRSGRSVGHSEKTL